MIARLESLGFTCFNTRRIGPCDRCQEQLQTYYIPEEHRWLCECCYYANPENTEFINFMFNRLTENMSSNAEILARLEQLERENAALKAKATDNIFVGGTDNLTLKHRQLNPRGWAVPTKNQSGVSYIRSGDFPMGFFLSQDGTKLVLHQEIPVSPHEVQLFKDRFLSQQIVVAKRRQQADATAQASTPPSLPTASTAVPSPAPAPVSTGFRKLSSVDASEKQKLMEEAKALFDGGMYSKISDAVEDVLKANKIER